ncbi:hypothetical protein HPC49_06750 [Pyxidicoccus fallax]|uniref:Vegetative protein n=1 Tax=Pyxidicoccus fallax TaxID=394095 RepID=A0A848LHG5_9BACT|nr:hypothetical protein [Pyxidicoccus fallax]NMO17285.1 hypothetical protein [Pyxidicoccus fallax]NPC77952.1 hypothetical protein [Pyxidicoccus fallax]
MARPRKELANVPLTPAMVNWAEALGDAIGRGMLRALNTGMPSLGSNGNGSNAMVAGRRRGRPPKVLASNSSGMVSADRRCTVDGCGREQRSKGLCSAHYQAERRRLLSGGKPA